MPFDTEQLKSYPTQPGVYLMKNSTGEVLYIGKAKNLRQRIKQYFVNGGDGRPMIPMLRSQVADIQTIVVLNEKEALLLENNLIKEHLPKYNALLKDDKSYIALKITRHQWPRIDLVRYRGIPEKDGSYFGPYTNAGAARRTLDLIHRIFPMRQCSDKEFLRRTRPCVLYDIKRCIAPCVGKCTQEEYDELVKRATKFLKGHDKEILKDLYAELQKYVDAMEFEEADSVYRTIKHIEKTMEGQTVDKPLGVDSDAVGLFRQGDEITVTLLLFRSGRLSTTRHYHFSKILQDDDELLHSFLLQHYDQKDTIPSEILLPVEISDVEPIQELLANTADHSVALLSPKKGNKYAMLEMAYLNAEATFKKEKDADAIRERTLMEMQERFHLTRYPRRIECCDISNLSGTETVATLVAFTDGQKDSKRYRKYKIRSADASDDYTAMHEVLTRRFRRAQEENDLPDLFMVDGGKGHLNIALKVLQEMNVISVDVISIAKEAGRHDRGITLEQIFLPNLKDPIILKHNSPILFMLQQIRDEAHRTAISYQRKRRSKTTVKSALEDIPGIGPAKRRKLLRYFGSIKQMKLATPEELKKAGGLSDKDIQAIRDFLNKENARDYLS